MNQQKQIKTVDSLTAPHTLQRQERGISNFDQRTSTSVQLQRQQQLDQSSLSAQLKNRVGKSGPSQDAPTQRMEDEEPAQRAKLDDEPIQGKFDTVQRQEEEDPAQKKSSEPVNNTGLPNQLKAGIESMSGMSMDHVKVHYNSDKPAQLNAHAYAQGSDIHVAPGQEQHVPHEAWHVVQQAQGRVKPTMQMKMGVPVNDDVGLETEADVMGAKAEAVGAAQMAASLLKPGASQYHSAQRGWSQERSIQRVRIAPAVANSAITAGPANVAYRDSVAPEGPTNMDSYQITMNAVAPNRDAALGDIRGEYRAIGTGFGAPPAGSRNTFLMGPGVRRQVGANNQFAAAVYDLWAPAIVPAHAALAPTVPQKAAHMRLPAHAHQYNVAANLDLLKNQPALQIPFKDPAEVNISAPYGGVGANLVVRVDFSEGQKGYVSRIQDAGGVDASMSNRANYAGEGRLNPEISRAMSNLRTDGIADFSNIHHNATNEDVGTQIARVTPGRDTRLHKEGGLDAMTKVIAEGGRFRCVENLGMQLRNDSLFFAVDPLGGFRTVEFRALWSMWAGAPLNGAYGIPDNAIRNMLIANPIPANVNQVPGAPAATGYHYDLNAHAVH